MTVHHDVPIPADDNSSNDHQEGLLTVRYFIDWQKPNASSQPSREESVRRVIQDGVIRAIMPVLDRHGDSTTMYTIEKNIPAPSMTDGAARLPTGIASTLDAMEVGDSIFVHVHQSTCTRLSSAMHRAKHRRAGREYTKRKVDGGWKIWRMD